MLGRVAGTRFGGGSGSGGTAVDKWTATVQFAKGAEVAPAG